jgi:hypothetical protein
MYHHSTRHHLLKHNHSSTCLKSQCKSSSKPPLAEQDAALIKNRIKKEKDHTDIDENEKEQSSPEDSSNDAPTRSSATSATTAIYSLQEAPSPPTLASAVFKLSRLSRFLKWYTSFISSSVNQDIGLKFMQYTFLMAAKALVAAAA